MPVNLLAGLLVYIGIRMQKGYIKYYIIEVLILLLSLLMINNRFYYTILWLLMTILFLLKYGFFRNKNYIKGSIIRTCIICLISYFLVIYIAGLFTGFYKNVFNTSFIGIIKNIYSVVILIICEEVLRYKFSRICKFNKIPYVIFTIILIILNIRLDYSSTINNTEELFIFICAIVLPNIASHTLYSYLSFNDCYFQNIILRVFTKIYIFILPILPGLGNYLISVVGITYPFLIYLATSKTIKYYNKEKKIYKQELLKFIYIPLLIFSIILVMLVSGFFKYQLIAIASGSMEPVIYRGDAVVFKKVDSIKDLEMGMVVAYKKNNILVTHRVVSIDYDKKLFKTKGDNNKTIDNYIVYENEIKGIVLYNIKYIGYPTVWLNDLK